MQDAIDNIYRLLWHLEYLVLFFFFLLSNSLSFCLPFSAEVSARARSRERTHIFVDNIYLTSRGRWFHKNYAHTKIYARFVRIKMESQWNVNSLNLICGALAAAAAATWALVYRCDIRNGFANEVRAHECLMHWRSKFFLRNICCSTVFDPR